MPRALLPAGSRLALAALLGSLHPGACEAREPQRGPSGWSLLHEETFDETFDFDAIPWVRDPLGKTSPWRTDHLGDDGKFFHVNGGPEFERQLKTFGLYRKRLPFGKDGWLTVELAARDADLDGHPDRPPAFRVTRSSHAGLVGSILEPDHHGGVLIRSTRPLPPVYRIECELVSVDFGGSRYGRWESGGRINGYEPEGPKTSHPWPWGPGEIFAQPYQSWPDVRAGNGFYYLAIMDYRNPAPHNNVFIHTHRKVVMDSYNVPGGGLQACNPAKGELYIGQDSAVDAFFAVPGTRIESRAVMETECGTITGGEGGRTPYVAAVQLVPELMPEQTYRFAIERDHTGYTLEMSGYFRFVGRQTYRYQRRFVQGGRPIWHYNQTPGEYDGAYDEEWTYEGPFGRLTTRSWPKGSAYPDYFIIGDPHINFYEGTASIDNLKLYVAAGD